MDFIRKFGFFAMATVLSFVFTSCGEEEVVVEEGPKYTESSIVFTYDYSGKVYDLVDLSYEVLFNEGTEACSYSSNVETGKISLSFTKVKPLSSISVKIVGSRNANPVDMADGIAYDRRDTPRFSITRHFDDGSIDSGGDIHSGSTNATGLDKLTLEEYISTSISRTFTVNLDEEGYLNREQVNAQ